MNKIERQYKRWLLKNFKDDYRFEVEGSCGYLIDNVKDIVVAKFFNYDGVSDNFLKAVIEQCWETYLLTDVEANKTFDLLSIFGSMIEYGCWDTK